MDPYCTTIAVFIFIQMVMILVMLNPVYDTRKITNYINEKTKKYKALVIPAVAVYFATIAYIGVYISLENIIGLVKEEVEQNEKDLVIIWTEKNCLMTGFSIFLAVVFYGLKCLVGYTACLVEQTDRQAIFPPKLLRPNTLTNPLQVKRSISYETILFAKDLREQLDMLLRNPAFYNFKYRLPNVLESSLRAD